MNNMRFEVRDGQHAFSKKVLAKMLDFVVFAKHSSRLNANESEFFTSIVLDDSFVKTMKIGISAETYL